MRQLALYFSYVLRILISTEACLSLGFCLDIIADCSHAPALLGISVNLRPNNVAHLPPVLVNSYFDVDC